MSRKKNPTTSDLENPTIKESSNTRTTAIKLSKEHHKWESKQSFEVLKPDLRTTIYRKVTDQSKHESTTKIHKGRI